MSLAARRDGHIGPIDERLLESAAEHRMSGLLATAASRTGSSGPGMEVLSEISTLSWAHNRLVAESAAKIIGEAAAMGVEVAVIKGVALEALCYGEMGERPTSDLDLVVHPSHLNRVPDLIRALQPNHILLPHLDDLIDGGWLGSVDLTVGTLAVDLHLDPLKLEVTKTAHPDAFWARRQTVSAAGIGLPTFDAEASLLLSLVHLNKDRFRYLIGYSDVVRLAALVSDWEWVERAMRDEGLRGPLILTLEAVYDDLDLGAPPLAAQGGVKATAWRRLWPADIRLSGSPGEVRYRYRQTLIPVLGSGHTGEVVVSWSRRMFPPRALLDAYYPSTSGPYPWRLVSGRVRRRVERRRRRVEAMARDQG